MKAQRLHVFILLLLATATCLAEAPFHDTDSTRKHKDRDASPHRLVESPTMNFSKLGIIHVDLGGALVFFPHEKEGFGLRYLRASIIVGKSFFDGMLYVEGGVYQPTLIDYDTEFPFTAAIRGVLLSTEEVRLGLGYQYFDLDYAYRLKYRSESRYLALHNIYVGFCWNPGNNTYAINSGIDMREDGRDLLSLTFGMSLSIGEHTQFILDIGRHGIYKDEAFGWGWIGFRFFNETITWDLTTFILLGYMLKVGIAL